MVSGSITFHHGNKPLLIKIDPSELKPTKEDGKEL